MFHVELFIIFEWQQFVAFVFFTTFVYILNYTKYFYTQNNTNYTKNARSSAYSVYRKRAAVTTHFPIHARFLVVIG